MHMRKQSVCHALKGLACWPARMPCPARARYARRLRPTLAAAPVLFGHAVVTVAKNGRILGVAGVRRQSVCHALKGLALPRACHFDEIALSDSRRLRSTLVTAPVLFAHAAVTEIKNK
jgi:hypothetical protein